MIPHLFISIYTITASEFFEKTESHDCELYYNKERTHQGKTGITPMQT